MLDPWVGKIPWRRKWQLTPVFLPGESHGQRSLAGCSPWGCKRVGLSSTPTKLLSGTGKIHATGILTQTALLAPALCVCVCVCVLAAQSCPTLCDPVDCSPPGSSIHRILQARILECVAISFSRGIFLTEGSNPGLPHCVQTL